jgi:hypothetical protein
MFIRARARLFMTASLLALAGTATADNEAFTGDWMLIVDQGRGQMYGRLELVSNEDGLVGYVENGPISVSVDDDLIELGVDDRTGGGLPFVRKLRGWLIDGVMEGTFGPENPDKFCVQFPTSCTNPTGTWRATQITDEVEGAADPEPVDMSGVWAPAAGGLGKFSMDLTPEAQEFVDGFRVDVDLPAQRCVSPGLARKFAMGGGAGIEIVTATDKVIFLYTNGEYRHIFLDGREPPEFANNTPLGFSTGHWEGSTLVVETTLLQASIRGFRGEPISDNARMTERYTLSEDGTRLSGLLMLHDPENYRRPPVRRRTWSRRSDAEYTPSDSCDPDSFYRQLHESGQMQDYIDRSHRRF